MKSPKGRILSVDGDQLHRRALVEVDAVVACQRCLDGKGCGAGLIGASDTERQVEATVASGLEVNDGDIVRLNLEPRSVLRAAVIVYGYPLAGAVLGALMSLAIGLGEMAAALFAIAGVGVGLFAARIRLRNEACLREFRPTVIEKLGVTLH